MVLRIEAKQGPHRISMLRIDASIGVAETTTAVPPPCWTKGGSEEEGGLVSDGDGGAHDVENEVDATEPFGVVAAPSDGIYRGGQRWGISGKDRAEEWVTKGELRRGEWQEKVCPGAEGAVTSSSMTMAMTLSSIRHSRAAADAAATKLS